MTTRRLSLALLLLATLGAGPVYFTGGDTLRIVAPADGISAAASLAEAEAGCYLVSVENERSCVCQNQTTCAETAAKDALCIPPSGVGSLRSRGAAPVSVWSAGGEGVVWFNPVACNSI